MNRLHSAILICAVFASPAKGEVTVIEDVQEYFQYCDLSESISSEVAEIYQAAICDGFANAIAGVANLNCRLRQRGVEMPSFFSADTTGVTHGAIRQALWNYAKNNPEYWSDSSAVLIAALPEVWPCQH